MKSKHKNQNAFQLAALALTLCLAVPALAAPAPVAVPDAPKVSDAALPTRDPSASPLTTNIRFVGDPEQEWAIELTGESEWGANVTSIEVWSPDGRVLLAAGEEGLRGRDLTTGKLWETLHFEPLEASVGELRISIEVDGGQYYGLNNDYHIQFYRIFTEPGIVEAVMQSNTGLATLVSGALEAARRDPSELPDRADSFYAWGSYGVAVDDMKGRCCNLTAMQDPPFSNEVPSALVKSTGEVPPALPDEVYAVVDLGQALQTLLPEDIRPSRNVLNGTAEPQQQSSSSSTRTQINVQTSDPLNGYDDSSTGAGRTVRIYGSIRLQEPDTTITHACQYCTIDLYDSDGGSTHDYFGTTNAISTGFFEKYVHVADGESAIDPYVRVGLNGPGRVVAADELSRQYYYNPGQAQLVNCSGTSCYLGVITIHQNSPTGSYGYEQFDRQDFGKAATAYTWATFAHDRIDGNGYDVQNTAVIRTPAEAPGMPADGGSHGDNDAHYDPVSREIHLGSFQATTSNTVAHEYGHFLMHEVYGTWDGLSCPPGRTFEDADTTACAWSEGFADFWSAHGLAGTTNYHKGNTVPTTRIYFSDSSWWDIESVTGVWSNGVAMSFDQGDASEVRVAGTLWDLVDGGSDGESVNLVTGTHVLPAMLHDPVPTNGQQTSIRAFYDDWRSLYGSGSSTTTGLRTVASHNTIDTTGWPA